MKNQLDIAIKLAGYYHSGQRDKNDEIYILHPLRIMFQMHTYEEKIVAVLNNTAVEEAPAETAPVVEAPAPARRKKVNIDIAVDD